MKALLFVLAVAGLSAQESAVDRFLQLDRAQRETILRNNAQHTRWQREKEERVSRVRGEIFEEAGRSPLDPVALGLRYAEIEAICREIDDREAQLVKVNRDVLNEAQRIKLAALEEAMKLAPTANAAIADRLIHASMLPSGALGIADFLLGREPAWPARQRSGVCAPNHNVGVAFGLPTVLPPR